MAYDQLWRVKTSMATALAEVMPNDADTGRPVPVHYAWPGHDHQKVTHVWFAGGRKVSEPGAQRAGRKRRNQTTTFDIVIECHLTGKTLDANGENVLQVRADEIVEEIAGVIDEWVADNPLLGQTTSSDVPVDWSTFDLFTLVNGPESTGCASRGICTISYHLRPL